jgi:transcriptional regulator with XRE-family HTH domain
MIGERLHRARKASGLSLRDLAERLGISQKIFSDIYVRV